MYSLIIRFYKYTYMMFINYLMLIKTFFINYLMFIKSLFIDGNILKYTIFIFLKLNSCFKAQLCHFMLQNYAFHEDNLNCRLNVFLLNINHISFNSCLFLYVTHSFEITIFCSFLLTFVSPFHHFSLNNYFIGCIMC